MPAPITISDEKRRQIWNAADELKAMGVNVTMKAIVEHMGGGSFAYVSPVLREWKDNQKPRFTVGTELPEELQPIVEQTVLYVAGEFKDKYAALYDAQLDKGLAEGELRIQNKDDQIQELEDEMARLDALRVGLESDKARLEEQGSEQQEAITAKDEQITELQTKLEQTQGHLNETGHALKDSQRDNKTLSEQLQQHIKVQNSQNALIDELKTQLNQTKQELTTALEQTASQQELMKANQDTLTLKEHKIEELEEKMTRAEVKAQRFRDAKAELQEHYEAKLKKLETSISGFQIRIDDRSTHVAKLEKANQEQKERLEALLKTEADFETAQNRIRELAIESGELKQENKELHKEVGVLQGQLSEKNKSEKTDSKSS